jgi:hypothetical protein
MEVIGWGILHDDFIVLTATRHSAHAKRCSLSHCCLFQMSDCGEHARTAMHTFPELLLLQVEEEDIQVVLYNVKLAMIGQQTYVGTNLIFICYQIFLYNIITRTHQSLPVRISTCSTRCNLAKFSTLVWWSCCYTSGTTSLL